MAGVAISKKERLRPTAQTTGPSATLRPKPARVAKKTMNDSNASKIDANSLLIDLLFIAFAICFIELNVLQNVTYESYRTGDQNRSVFGHELTS